VNSTSFAPFKLYCTSIYYISHSIKDKDVKEKLFLMSNKIIPETSRFEFLSDFGRLKFVIILLNEVLT